MADIIPKRVLEEIRFKNDIVDVVSSYFELKRSGSTFKALCPFHREKTPSFHVNPQRQIYHCFGCGAGGDVFAFLQQVEGVDFVGAARLLARRANVELELEDDRSGVPNKQALYDLVADVAARYHKALRDARSAAPARRYLEERRLSGTPADDFEIGFAPNRWDTLVNWARRASIDIERLETVGLVIRREGATDGRTHYDRFRNRLMFPIRDEQGRVIGFSGRALNPEDETAKYINSPETPLFTKSRVLYALDRARRAIVDSRDVIVCEGQIDVIRCHQAGFVNAVAPQGTALTDDHVRMVHRYADSAVLVFDPDSAGRDAAVRSAGVFLAAGMAVRVATLPEGEDPDSLIRAHGADAFRAVLDHAGSVVRFQIDMAGADRGRGEAGIMRTARAVLQTIARSPNAVQRAALVREAAERLNLPGSALHDDLRFELRRIRRHTAHAAEPASAAAPARPPEEVALCELLAHVADAPELAELVARYLPPDRLRDPCCRAVAAAALDACHTGRDLQAVLRDLDDPPEGLQAFAAQLEMAPLKVKADDLSHADAARSIILRIWQRRLEEERAQLDTETGGKPQGDARMRRHQITHDLRHLRTWEDGEDVITMLLDA
jgi:DNA primase